MERAQALSLVMLFMFGMPLLLTVAEYLPVDADLVAGFFVAATLAFALFASGVLRGLSSVAAVLPLAAVLALLAPGVAYRLASPIALSNAKLAAFKLATDAAELARATSTFGARAEPLVRLLSMAGSAPPRFVLSDVERDDIELVAELPVSLLNELSGAASSSLGAAGGTMQLLYVKTTRRVKNDNVVVVLPVLVPPVPADDRDNDQVRKPAWHPHFEPSDDELAAATAPRKANKAQALPAVWLSGELIPFDVTASPDAAEFRLTKKYKNVRPMALLVTAGSGVGAPSDAAMPVLAYAALTAPLALVAALKFYEFYLVLGARPRQTSRPTRVKLSQQQD